MDETVRGPGPNRPASMWLGVAAACVALCAPVIARAISLMLSSARPPGAYFSFLSVVGSVPEIGVAIAFVVLCAADERRSKSWWIATLLVATTAAQFLVSFTLGLLEPGARNTLWALPVGLLVLLAALAFWMVRPRTHAPDEYFEHSNAGRVAIVASMLVMVVQVAAPLYVTVSSGRWWTIQMQLASTFFGMAHIAPLLALASATLFRPERYARSFWLLPAVHAAGVISGLLYLTLLLTSPNTYTIGLPPAVTVAMSGLVAVALWLTRPRPRPQTPLPDRLDPDPQGTLFTSG